MSCGGYVWQLLQRQQQPMATMLAQQQYALAQQQQQMGRDHCFEPALLHYLVPHATFVVICLNPIQHTICLNVSLSICYIVQKKYTLFCLLLLFEVMAQNVHTAQFIPVGVCCTGISHASKPSQICVLKGKNESWIGNGYT